MPVAAWGPDSEWVAATGSGGIGGGGFRAPGPALSHRGMRHRDSGWHGGRITVSLRSRLERAPRKLEVTAKSDSDLKYRALKVTG